MATFDINMIPAMAPPLGQTSNFDNPETMHPVVLGVAIATIALMVIAVAIRVYTKGVIMRDMKVEECQSLQVTPLHDPSPVLIEDRLCYCRNGMCSEVNQKPTSFGQGLTHRRQASSCGTASSSTSR
jgi:hypothetical protein